MKWCTKENGTEKYDHRAHSDEMIYAAEDFSAHWGREYFVQNTVSNITIPQYTHKSRLVFWAQGNFQLHPLTLSCVDSLFDGFANEIQFTKSGRYVRIVLDAFPGGIAIDTPEPYVARDSAFSEMYAASLCKAHLRYTADIPGLMDMAPSSQWSCGFRIKKDWVTVCTCDAEAIVAQTLFGCSDWSIGLQITDPKMSRFNYVRLATSTD
jgi:hypothetical protein